MSVKLKTETIADQEIDFMVEQSGKFSATVGEVEYYGATLEELREKVTKAAKRLRDTEAVPVTVLNMIPRNKSERPVFYDDGPFVDGIGVVHAMLRGKNERGGYWLLAEGEKGKGAKFKLSCYREAKNISRRLTAEEVEQYTQLATAVAHAEAALESFMQSVAIDPAEALGYEHGRKVRK